MNLEELKKIPTLIRWSKYKIGYPVRIDLAITNNCNLSCCFCKQGIYQKIHTNELTKEELLSTINQGYEFGVFNWNIVGEGEPLVKADTTLEVMSLIKKYGMMGNLTTNGTLFNEKIVSKFIDVGWDCINFSIDSGEAAMHDNLRGKKGAFQRAKKSMILFSTLKKTRRKQKPDIIIHSILHNQNYNKLNELVDLAHEINASRLDFTHILPLTIYTKKLELNKEQLIEFNKNIPIVLDYAHQKKVLTNLNDYKIEVNEITIHHSSENKKDNKKSMNWLFSVHCYNPWVSMIVLANGLVGPCCRYTDEKCMGNIRTNNLADIWFGKIFNDYRKNMIDHRLYCINDCPSTEVIRNKKLQEELIKICSMNLFIKYKRTISSHIQEKINNFINF